MISNHVTNSMLLSLLTHLPGKKVLLQLFYCEKNSSVKKKKDFWLGRFAWASLMNLGAKQRSSDSWPLALANRKGPVRMLNGKVFKCLFVFNIFRVSSYSAFSSSTYEYLQLDFVLCNESTS